MPRTQRRKVVADLIRAAEAARIIGVSRPTVLAMVARKELDGEVVAGVPFVSRKDAERVAAARRDAAPVAA